jgi:hypothetical protein
MGSLPGYSRSNSSQGNSQGLSSNAFQEASDAELEQHLEVFRYGAFDLTDAIRPSLQLPIIPRQGFRHDCYSDDSSGVKVPVIMAAASRERLFDLFIDLIDPLGQVVDVVIETSHYGGDGSHQDLYREHIDMPVLKSVLYDYEELLLNDGCAGVAVLNPAKQQEVQFDEHKMLIIYGTPLEHFERILIKHDVYIDPKIKFITEAEHVHSSSEKYYDQIMQLAMRLGIDTIE